MRTLRTLLNCLVLVVLLQSILFADGLQSVTLYPPVNPQTKKYDEGKSLFSFKYGLLKEVTKSTESWDLSYGFLIVNDEDWFGLHFGRETRTVVKDIGEFTWRDSFAIPVLEPRPRVEKEEKWETTVDVSGDAHGAWTRTGEFAKVVLGHMYVMHVKDESHDFYAMFRVDAFEQHKFCTISWRLVPAPSKVD